MKQKVLVQRREHEVHRGAVGRSGESGAHEPPLLVQLVHIRRLQRMDEMQRFVYLE